jgi:hypothetical protein
MSKMIKLARYRNYGFTVNYNMNDGMRRVFEWSGSKNGKVDIKDVPEEIVQYLMMNTVTFTDGELVIIEDSEDAKEIISNINEEYKNNAHSREEIVKLLEGNFMKMKAEIGKITNKQELSYICDVAKEIKLDSNSKLAYLAEIMKMPQDILFANEDE